VTEQTWEFVRAEDADIPEMLELSRFIHGDDSGLADPGYFRWLALENPAGQAIHWVAKETTTGRIIAIVWGIAVPFKVMDYESTVYYSFVRSKPLVLHFRRLGD